MIRLAIKTLCCAAMLITLATDAAAQNITWYKPNFPPYMIVKGTKAKHGIDNQIIKFVINRLPEYGHFFEVANYKRILNKLQNQKDGVITPLFKTAERKKYIHYSKKPSYFVFSNGFIYRQEDRKKYTPFLLADGTLDIEALCNSGLFNIGISSGRSYYGIIDKLIKKHSHDKTFHTRTSVDHVGLLKMVSLKRIDAAFGFPVEIKYAGFDDNLKFFNVSKMPSLTPVFFGAPKNEFGFQIIQKLNAILENKNVRLEFGEYYLYWLDDEMKTKYKEQRKNYHQEN